jgi:glutamate formiminotransferase / formiminotetrahydrofolate cyclodeaminase
MLKKIVECVPNISEGRDPAKIKAVTDVVETVEGVKLLDVDPGSSTNRTVITFVGEPDQVVEAAFRVIQKAAEVIDMSKHHGEHPRMGATDVCPFVPVANVTMEECAALAHKLGKRVGEELGIPGYFYEEAATQPKRKNLAHCRSGQYEGLEKLNKPEWKPDFGPAEFNAHAKKTGATAIGARDFLVAYNVNLNSTSTRRANAIAFDIREAGRIKLENGLTGKKVLDENGEPVRIPGSLKAVKGIGWYIEEYGVAQLSLNLTNINITPVHIAFDEAVAKSAERGIRVTGSEIVGLIPKRVLIDAADYYLKKQERSLGINDEEKIKIAVKSLGLDDLAPFHPKEKVIEYLLEDQLGKQLVDMDLVAFANETASESMAPGGGSISAYVGALGISLGCMVANLSAHKRGWDSRWEEFSNWAEQGMSLQKELLHLVDEDTRSFNGIISAFQLPKGTEDEKKARAEAIQAATKYAIEVPLKAATICLESMEVMLQMTKIGNPNSITDAAVGAMCARTGVLGAAMNVKINTGDLADKAYVAQVIEKVENMESKAEQFESEVRILVQKHLSA